MLPFSSQYSKYLTLIMLVKITKLMVKIQKVQTVTVFQYGNQDYVPSQEDLNEKIITHYKAFGGTNIEIINQWTFRLVQKLD